MDLELFKKRIQNTALLTDERKAYYISRADVYPADVRQKMVDALLEQEKAFIEAETKNKKDRAKQHLVELLKREEKEHKVEMADAEKMVEGLMGDSAVKKV